MLSLSSKAAVQIPANLWRFRIDITYLCSKYFSQILFKSTDCWKVVSMQYYNFLIRNQLWWCKLHSSGPPELMNQS